MGNRTKEVNTRKLTAIGMLCALAYSVAVAGRVFFGAS